MDADTAAGIVAAAATVIGGVLALVREITARRSRRSAIVEEIEILNALPADASSRQALQDHVDRSIDSLIVQDETARLGWTGVMVASTFLIGGTAAAYGALQGWWWLWPIVLPLAEIPQLCNSGEIHLSVISWPVERSS